MDFSADIGRITKFFRGRKEVSALYVFGSASKGSGTSESDIDLAVLLDERRLGDKTVESFRKTYYAFSPGFSLRPVDIVILNSAPPYLKHRILKTGSLVFERNRRLRVRFKAKAIIEYLDYKPIEDLCLRAASARLRRTADGR